jgi:HK97 family phage portal protein
LELVPLRPDLVSVEQLTNRRLRYKLREGDGNTRTISQENMLHVRGRALDFVSGMSVHTQARDAIAIARAIDTFESKFFANDASIGVVAEHPGVLKKEAYDKLKADFSTMFGGVGNSHRPRILEEGMKLTRLPMGSPKDAQLSQAAKDAVLEICRFFRVPPHKVQLLDNAHYNNVEAQNTEFATDTMVPIARRWESCIKQKLVSDPEMYARFEFKGLLRGDNVTRAAYYQSRFNIGSLSPNDIRRLEDENPIADPAADRYYVQGALVPIDRVDEVLSRSEQAVVGPAAPDEEEDDAPAPQRTPARAFQMLLADAAERLTKAEVRAIEKRHAKAAEDPARFSAWLESFYGEHAEYATKALQPLALAWAAAAGSSVDLATLVPRIVAVGYRTGEDFTAWSAHRAADLTVLLVQAFACDRERDALALAPANPYPPVATSSAVNIHFAETNGQTRTVVLTPVRDEKDRIVKYLRTEEAA